MHAPNTKPPQVYFIYWRKVPVLVPPEAMAVRDVPVKRRVVMLAEDCEFWIVHGFQTYKVTVPHGFMSDGPSTPPWAQLILHDYKADIPAFFHDVGYYTQGFNEVVPKEAWDHYFSQAMIGVDQASWKLGAMYLAVKRAGHRAWRDRSPIDLWNEEQGIFPELQPGHGIYQFTPLGEPITFLPIA